MDSRNQHSQYTIYVGLLHSQCENVGNEKFPYESFPGLTHLRMLLLVMIRSQAPSGNELENTTHLVLMLERAVRRQSITIVSRSGIRSTTGRTSSVEHSLLQRDK